MKNPNQILKTVYGYDHFRGEQAAIIDQLNAGKNAFVLMPTGGGKSLCYQIPSLCREGVGVIVSPLIALMQDQVLALQQLGVRARAINSSLTPQESYEAKALLRAGELDMVYVAPERLLTDDFLALLHDSPIALFAIDEAHCVSQWGHDFRPEYAKLSILRETFPEVPCVALTATADTPTRQDIVEKLCLQDGQTFVAGFDRPNIHYQMSSHADSKKRLLDFINTEHKGDSGIVYCLSRKKVDDTAAWLKKEGLNAFPYHAGMSSAERNENQAHFIKEESVIIVATIAFGMGIDKPNVRFVAHMSLPKNIEAYYQETGRAGRDGLPADAWMSYGLNDVSMQRMFIENGDSSDNQKRIEHQKLNALLGLCEAIRCRRQILLDYFGDACEPCGNCDVCNDKPKTFNATAAAQKALSCVYRTGSRFGVAYLIDVLLGVNSARIKQFQHDQLSTYGIGKEFDKGQWQAIFRQLVTHNFLHVDMAGHGGLSITPEGKLFLQEKRSLALREYVKPSRSRRARTSKSAGELIQDTDKTLFEKLRAKRLALSKEQNVPPYVIFHDKTLVELAKLKPVNQEQMLEITGVGAAKFERYGELFLDVICSENSAG